MTPERWQQIERLYHTALEHDTGERAVYLKEACAGDDALRREVESLLAHDGARGLLESQCDEQTLIGRHIGCYQVVSFLGAGGMGEVYEARDTKLGRNVAIKVLPSAFVHDSERLARFQREARMLAALNHPNIATIYGLEHSEGVHYLMMELVPGQTLAERISKGTLPVEEALKVAGQVAEALEAAHERGIVHRDLKPANVRVTPQGRVKVLDFGLAKAFLGDAEQDLSQAATLGPTEEGRILGTPSYMSPEQARGKTVDKRTDIWAFGCVLFELLTGKRAFRGETISDTIAVVLEREPDWQVLPPETPAKIRDLLRRCLQKDSPRRLRDIGDARIEIEEGLAAPAVAEPTATTKSIRARWRGTLPWGVAFLLLAAVTSIAIWNRKSLSAINSGPVSRIAITLPPDQPFAGLEIGSALALSPDGTHLVYAAHQGGVEQLYLRPLAGLEAKPIPGTEGAVEPFFSPDGQWLGFFADGKLKKVLVSGGEVTSLCDAGDPRGASWASRGTIIFAPTRAAALEQVSDAGGSPKPLTRFVEEREGSHRWPEFLPGGDAVLFAAFRGGGNWNEAQISVQSVRTGERRALIQGGTNPRYAPSGHLVYAQGGNLMAVPFDAQKLAVTGAAVPVVEGVLQSTFTGAAQYSFSDTGSLVYVPGSVQGQRRLVWVSRSGAEEPVAAPARAYRGPRLSPDGREVAVAIEGQETEIWLYDLSRETLHRLTSQGGADYDPAWTRDGKRVVFHSTTGVRGLFWQLADSSGQPERLLNEWGGLPYSLSPDGQLLAFRNNDATPHISVLRLGDRKVVPFPETRFQEGAAQFSPDGRWLAYVSDETGRYEIYVQPYPGPGGKWQISAEGGTEPLWNPNGRELFYRSGDKMMAVEIATQTRFSAGKPKVLFAGQFQPSPSPVPTANYDVSPDGQRFLILKPSGQDQAPTQINVVLNWFEELKRRVPTGK